MIKIQKGNEPPVLTNNRAQWTRDLMALVKKYGSYDKIPEAEKKTALKPYSHPDIVKSLKGCISKAKCIYCESYVDVSGYANVEHFHPKSLYPIEAFEWKNLFVGCTLCNIPKNSFDTKKEPFIHPVNEDPEDYLTFDELQYVPKFANGLDWEKAKNVIECCDLKRITLVHEHALILESFLKTKESLTSRINIYHSHVKNATKIKDATAILASLDILNLEASDDAQYAAYMRYLLRKYDVILEAVNIINNHKDELGLPHGYKWRFNF